MELPQSNSTCDQLIHVNSTISFESTNFGCSRVFPTLLAVFFFKIIAVKIMPLLIIFLLNQHSQRMDVHSWYCCSLWRQFLKETEVCAMDLQRMRERERLRLVDVIGSFIRDIKVKVKNASTLSFFSYFLFFLQDFWVNYWSIWSLIHLEQDPTFPAITVSIFGAQPSFKFMLLLHCRIRKGISNF